MMSSSNAVMRNPRSNPRHRRWAALAFFVAGVGACRAREPAPAPAPAAAPVAVEPSAAPRAEPAPAAAPAVVDPPPGWSNRLLTDEVPLCVFADERERGKALFVEQVRRQTLRANAPVTFGVFPPGCLNKACDDLPLLQCWVEADGGTLTVHSRFASVYKDGSSCNQDCLEADSACESPVLAPGKYTVRYGKKQFEVRIPSIVQRPCFQL